MTGIRNASLEASFGFSPELRAKALVEAIPYIQKFSGKVILVKMGGSALIDEGLFSKFAQDIVLLASVGIQPVVVHGGGPQIGQYLKQIGKKARLLMVFVSRMEKRSLQFVRFLFSKLGKK